MTGTSVLRQIDSEQANFRVARNPGGITFAKLPTGQADWLGRAATSPNAEPNLC
jgi:hypothetical protein